MLNKYAQMLRGVRAVRQTTLLLGTSAVFLIVCASVRAEERMPTTVMLRAGETYVINDLDSSNTPAVSYANNPHSFIVRCGAPSQCTILAMEAGDGQVKAVLNNGQQAIFNIVVSAIARPGAPLAPGVAPADPIATAVAPIASNSVMSGSTHLQAVTNPTDLPGPPAAVVPSESSPSLSSQSANDTSATRDFYRANRQVHAAAPFDESDGENFLPASTITVLENSSEVYDFGIPLRRVAVADTKIADVNILGATQLMIVGHQAGLTSLVVWQTDGRYHQRHIRVEHGGPQQVQLNVLVAEINRTRLEQQGMDLSVALTKAGLAMVGLPGNVATPYNPGDNLSATGGSGTLGALPPTGVLPSAGQFIPLVLSGNMTYGISSQNGQVTTNEFFQFLEDHQLARILARPQLMALSGEQAQFLSGGEIPIVISQALNTTIVFKQFGTSVTFIPTVIDRDEIELVVKPEFSQPDFSQGVEVLGFRIPAFVTRRAETTVRLRANQTLIIAGLVLDTTQAQIQKVPYVGDVPYLGALFRHTINQHVKTELVMTVVPQIVAPIPFGGIVELPTSRPPMSPAEIRTVPLEQPDVTRPRF